MTNRERMLAIMGGRSPDRIPWIPRLRIWHTAHARLGTLPERFQGMDRRQVEQELGMGTAGRGGRVFTEEQTGDVEVTTSREGSTTLTTYRTPAGTVSTRFRGSDELDRMGIQSLEVEHMIKEPRDFAVVEYLVTHKRYEPAYDDFHAYDARVGDDGYPLVGAGDCPFHIFLQEMAGYTNGYYLLSDCPEQVEHLLRTMEEGERERLWPVVAESPARLILHGIHFDSTLTPPPLFSRYITPYYRDFSDLLHQNDKTLCMHADNDSRLILGHLEEAGFDMVESFTTAPQVSCTLEQAREAWGNRVIIWGGLPSVLLEPAHPEEEFEAYMRQLFRTIAPGAAFILGVADNIMPDAMLGRLERVSEMVTDWGEVPIDPARVA
jgi:uroporphyrinogen-III decarboxylase